MALTICAAAAISACGGKTDSTTAAASTSYSDVPASTTYTTPPAITATGDAGTFTDSTDTGNKGIGRPSTQLAVGGGAAPGVTTTLNYVVYDKNFAGGAPASTAAVNTISEASTFTVSTFTSPVAMVAIDAEDRDSDFTTTSFGSSTGSQTPASPAPANGKSYAYGNVLSYCTSGGSTTSNDALNTDQITYFSENMVPVTAASELNGKTFTAFQCSEQGMTTVTWVFDSGGGVTQNYGTNAKTFSSTQAAGMFSASGFTISSISRTIYLRAYKFTNAANATKYFLVDRVAGSTPAQGARVSTAP